MQVPVQVVFHGVENSPALQEFIHELAEKVCRGTDRVTRCHVTVELPHRHQNQGRNFQVRVYLHVAGEVGVLGGVLGHHVLAAREAFAIARRNLDEAIEKARGW
jgi:ribosome-associated translation inhibitor RaiA